MSAAEAHYAWDSPVFFDEMDPNGTLHNSRFAVHVERALSAWNEAEGMGWRRLEDRHEDLRYAVRAFAIEFHAPVVAPGSMRVELWLDRVGTTSAVHRFRCASPAGTPAYATGRRTIVKIGPSGAEPWSPWFRALAERYVT
jgi:acyl-CoA thioester hydrolase